MRSHYFVPWQLPTTGNGHDGVIDARESCWKLREVCLVHQSDKLHKFLVSAKPGELPTNIWFHGCRPYASLG